MIFGSIQLILIVNIMWLNCTGSNTYSSDMCVYSGKEAADVEICMADSVGRATFYFTPSMNPNTTWLSFKGKEENIEGIKYCIVDVEEIKKSSYFLEAANKIWKLNFLLCLIPLKENKTNQLLSVVETEDNTPITVRELFKTYSIDEIRGLCGEIDLEQSENNIKMLRQSGISRKDAKRLLTELLFYSFSDNVVLSRHCFCNYCYKNFVYNNIENPSLLNCFTLNAVRFSLNPDGDFEDAPQCFDWAVMDDSVGFVIGLMTFQDLIRKIRVIKR